MKIRRLFIILVVALALVAFGHRTFTFAQSGGKEIPGIIVIAVTQGGGMLNALGSGLAKLITEKTPTSVRLRSSSGGLDALVHAGDADIGMGVSVVSHQSYQGIKEFKGRPQTKLRLIASGPPLILGFMVRKDSPYQTVEDLKGKKVAGEYPNTRPLYFDGKAMFNTADMTWEDVSVVPVASIGGGVQAFIQGRVEAAICAVGSGFARQADAKTKGMRFIGMPSGPETGKKLWEGEPGFYVFPAKAGMTVGINKDMVLAAKDIYLNANMDMSEELVYLITKAMWNEMKTLHTVHPMFKRWSQRAMVKANVTIPYHEGAIRFYKEVKKWTPEIEKVHQGLLNRAGK